MKTCVLLISYKYPVVRDFRSLTVSLRLHHLEALHSEAFHITNRKAWTAQPPLTCQLMIYLYLKFFYGWDRDKRIDGKTLL